MPAIASMTLNGISGADHVFTPDHATDGLVTWVKRGTAPVGDEVLTMKTYTTPTGKIKSTIRLILPKTQDVTVNGVTLPTVVSRSVIDVSFTSDRTAPDSSRFEMLDLIRSIVSFTDNPDISNSIAYGAGWIG